MTQLYIRAGLFAEGPTDYRFLLPLLDRLLAELAAELFPGRHEVAASVDIDAPRGFEGRRAEKIAAAIHERWDECTLFVIHADGAGDPEGARATQVVPGIDAARASRPDREVIAVGCVPVREIEAWLLVDPEVFRALSGAVPACPAEPERDPDPKATLRRVLGECGLRRPPEYRFFGEQVRIDSLDALPAFRTFRHDLMDAIGEAARVQGVAR